MLCDQKTTEHPTQIWTEGMCSNMAAEDAAINDVFREHTCTPHNLEADLAQNMDLTADGDDLAAVIADKSQNRSRCLMPQISDLKKRYLV